MPGNPTQDLNQKVCQKYGWSARFEKEQDADATESFWVCYLTVGLNDERRFVSQDSTSNEATPEGKKEGIASASRAALDGLAELLAIQEAKPKVELTQAFPLYPPGSKKEDNLPPRFVIRGSSPGNWKKYIWGPLSKRTKEEKDKPFVVGIDTEGNQKSPPVLIQIATQDCVLLEITSMLGNKLSDDLRRLLQDDSITKIFCDNYAHHDKKSLGLWQDNNKPADFDGRGSVVDLEVLAANALGPVRVARGLSRIVTLVMPELNVIIGKPQVKKKGRFKDIGKFALIEQGKIPPLQSLRDLKRKEQVYAAMDAWATLQAYQRMKDLPSTSSSSPGTEVGTTRELATNPP